MHFGRCQVLLSLVELVGINSIDVCVRYRLIAHHVSPLTSDQVYQNPRHPFAFSHVYLLKTFNSRVLKIAYEKAANANPSSNPTSPPVGAGPADAAIGPTYHD